MITAQTNTKEVLGAMDIGDLLSRGWRLYRLNFSKVIFYSLLPTIIFSLAQLFINMPSFVGDDPFVIIGGLFCCFPMGLILSFVGIFVSILFNYGMVKAFFNILIGEKADYDVIYEHIKEQFSSILKLSGLITIEAIVFFAFSITLLIISFVLFFFVVGFVVAVLPKENAFISWAAVIFSTIIIIGIIFSYLAIICVQVFYCAMQVIITAVEGFDIKKCFYKSFNFLVKDLPKTVCFLFALSILGYILLYFFLLPGGMLVGYIVYLQMSMLNSSEPPVLVLVLWQFLINIVSMLLWPFVVSSMVLFYYDLIVKKEGFDLIQFLNNQKIQELK